MRELQQAGGWESSIAALPDFKRLEARAQRLLAEQLRRMLKALTQLHAQEL